MSGKPHRRKGRQPSGPRKTAGASAPAPGADAICPVVAIGASAGGLRAYSRLLGALPQGIGMAVVLVQHLDPKHESILADILARESGIAVTEVTDNMALEPGRVYVIPPGVTMTLDSGRVRLVKRPASPAEVLPIDTFMKSIAQQCEGRAVGVVLSGTGSDGTLGLIAIREAGGVTYAQDPPTAEYQGMPQAAIDAGAVDSVLDPEHIAKELARLGAHPAYMEPRTPETAPDESDEEDEQWFRSILSLVREATGLDLEHYRHTTLMRRITRRMALEGVPTMAEYARRLGGRPAGLEALYRDILVNVTEFFREPEALEALKSKAFPDILERKGPDETVRVWVPGCSTGQEAYSILMSLVEFLEGTPSCPRIQMFASDVNDHDVQIARAGLYPERIAGEVSAERLARFFTEVPGGYQIDPSIRDMCVFAVHDVTRDPPFSRLDLVSLRNVLIYMERTLQKRVLQTLHYALDAGGFLLLGSSETVNAESSLFSVVDKRLRLYRRMPGPARLLPAPARAAGIGFDGKGRPAETSPVFDPLTEADRMMRDRFQPSGMVVDSDLEVLQFRGSVGRYLDPAEGPPEMNVSRLVEPQLSATIEAAIREAAETGASATRRGLARAPDGATREVDIEAVPMTTPSTGRYYVVLLKDGLKETPKGKKAAAPGKAGTADTAEASELVRELDQAREQLSAVASERQAAVNDLRAAIEKSRMNNEELRTINEEFQTAQEELQSTNEELTTLNDELRNRNEELARLNDDLANVIKGAEIPILILDDGLRIRRFTPQADAIVNIVPADLGRPISDLRLKVEVPDLETSLRTVLREREPSETDVRAAGGHWYSMRLRPYMTAEGVVAGIVVAFLDIDGLKGATRVAEVARDHAEAIVQTVRQPLLTLGPELRVQEANQAFYDAFAVTPEETIGRQVYDLGDGQWDFPELRSLLGQVVPTGRGFADLEVEHDFPGIGHRVMVLYARRVREEDREPSVLLAIDDLTSVRRRQRLRAALNDIGVIISSTLESDRLAARLLEQSTEILRAESGLLALRSDDEWVIQAAHGLAPGLVGRVLDEREPPIGALTEAGEPLIIGNVAEEGGFASSVCSELGVRSALVVPLLHREQVVGSLSFHHHASRGVFDDEDVAFARRLGTLLSLALENARLYSAQRDIANTLQAALLTVPRRVAGVDFGYLYQSATKEAAVGGDFYDLFELENGRVGLLLGDVSGKGVQAAAQNALVRNTVRALAYENDSPAAVITKTNDIVFRATSSSVFATMLYCVLDVPSGRLLYCSAGQTPGIVRKKDGGIRLLDVGSPLAGGFLSMEFREGEIILEKGDMLILYSDGVTEARRDGEMFQEERLHDFVRRMPPMRPRDVPAAIFDEVMRFAGGTLSDDIAIVAIARAEEE